MKVFAVLFHIFILLYASESFELTKTSFTNLLSNSSIVEDEYLKIYKDVQGNHLLNQLFIEQESVIPIDQSSASCFQAIAYLLSANLNGKSFQFLDSWGSIPSGILYGHSVDIGNFDECLAARATIDSIKKEIRGKYVLVKLSPAGNNAIKGALELALMIGTCFPHTCSDETVQKIFQTTINNIPGMTKNNSSSKLGVKIHLSKTELDDIPYSASSITAISIFSIIGALMLFSTVYEYVMMKRKTPTNQLLIAYSVLENGRKLFHINTNTSSNNIDCLNGLRVFSMMWIIYGHSNGFYSGYPLINLIDAIKYLKAPFSMLVQASPFAVDSFLLISGLVLTWAAMHKMEKTNGKLNIPLMYLQRYLRLTPIMAACILIVVGIWPLLNQGPLEDWSQIEEYCHRNWWTNLLYINNYFRIKELCVGQSWYIAVDMQLFIISPIFLYGLWRCKSKFLWFVLLVILLSIGCCIASIITNDINGIIAHGLYIADYMKRVHFPTHIRITSWLIGVALGYWFHLNHKKPQLSLIHLTIGWIVALGLIVAVVYTPYNFSKDLSAATPVEAAMFAAFGRIAWSLSLSWIIFTCHKGYSRTLNSFLSYSGWQPIARLTYAMYMISMTLQSINLSLNRTDAYFSIYSFIQVYSSELVLSLVFAIIAVLALESPIIAITKYLFEGKKKEKSQPSA